MGKINNDPLLVTYFREINDPKKYPLLSREEEEKYAIRKENGDESARKKLIESNLRFVVTIAKKYQGRGLSLNDLIEEGNIGLIDAVERYDYRKGPLISYARWWIMQKILKSLHGQEMIRIPMNKKYLLHKIKRKLYNYEKTYHENINDISKKTGVKETEIDYAFNISTGMLSIDAREDKGVFLEEKIQDSTGSLENILIKKELKNEINTILMQLTDREKKIIEYRFGLNEKAELSLRQIGKRCNLTKERIRQIVKGVIENLQSPEIKEKLISYLEE